MTGKCQKKTKLENAKKSKCQKNQNQKVSEPHNPILTLSSTFQLKQYIEKNIAKILLCMKCSAELK